jgi:hypothetical protein
MVHGVGTALVLSKPGCWSVNRDRRVVVMFGSSSAFATHRQVRPLSVGVSAKGLAAVISVFKGVPKAQALYVL